ncbi:heterogeneous nuclear ribonucleoprotein M-like [Acanthaster planci]|uniref:Heterogeneous nuclear ribonucleoprotein M-like n=1 Tax=Acanthaster planci TaxID=133434 RepID=A0A8B7YVW5_ACAPL|nr:heterogeneous nuclear ribonucleoprotein M-like [Acanthaster planci]
MEMNVESEYQHDQFQEQYAMGMQDTSMTNTPKDEPESFDTTSNGQNANKSSNQTRNYRGGLKGSRSRIRFHPYKGIGTRTYTNSVFVSNIPYELSEQEFKDLFEQQVGKVVFCEIFPEPGGLSTGCGVVEMENPTDVEKAVFKMKKYQIQGRGLVVRDDRDLSYSSRYRSPPVVKPQSSIVNPEVLHRLGIHPDDVSETVHVANLSEEVDLRKLKDVFSLAGLVMNLEILKDEQGKSLGLATVTYSSCEEAVNAISMFDNQSLFELKMSVRMDKSRKRLQDPEKQKELPQGLGGIGQNLLARGPQGGGMGGLPMGGAMMGGPMGGAAMFNRMGGGGDFGGGYDRPMGGIGRGFDMGIGMGYPSGDAGGGYGGGFGGGPMRNYVQGSPGAVDPSQGCQVFVRNLSPEVSWEDLKDCFKKIGPVYYADVKKDNEGKSKGFGTVKYHNPQHAQQAILLLNGANLKGRRIAVTFGRF